MSFAIRWAMEPQKVLAYTSISGTYAKVGTVTLYPGRQFMVSNLTDANLQFSWNGVDDHFPMLSGTQWINDVATNQILDQGLSNPQNATLWVKTIDSPTKNSVYFSSMYGAGAVQ